MTVTFCGHSTLSGTAPIRKWLLETTGALIAEGADFFYLGGYGMFDALAFEVMREQKRAHPHITLALALPYLDSKLSTDGYDEIIYPPLETVPKRYAIVCRNRWMVEMADYVVVYIEHDWGGAYKTYRYAKSKRKKIFNLAELK